ncbi:hypothetical protein ACFSQT_20585 [Mesorhizobium calcicola]|uniref:Uncharacterized protein n=1 Tax=Mesorhizobium calcicola TaxID=1300310 RepID=A0ABW4WH37_9HYPH
MAITTLHDTDEGIHRLMNAMFDLGVYDGWPRTDVRLADTDAVYQEYFDGYRMLMHDVCDAADTWWTATIQAQRNRGLDDQAAVKAAFADRLAGAAAYPKVVWMVRFGWLAVAELNKAQRPDQRVRPETFLLQWMIDEGETEIVRLLACMPYWPIGLDEHGDWC